VGSQHHLLSHLLQQPTSAYLQAPFSNISLPHSTPAYSPRLSSTSMFYCTAYLLFHLYTALHHSFQFSASMYESQLHMHTATSIVIVTIVSVSLSPLHIVPPYCICLHVHIFPSSSTFHCIHTSICICVYMHISVPSSIFLHKYSHAHLRWTRSLMYIYGPIYFITLFILRINCYLSFPCVFPTVY
jgi:hypothetical protein